jgi:uncharacterized protein (DUF2249 family)
MNKNCQTCGKLFEKKVNCSIKEWRKSRYCSRKCVRNLFKQGESPWNKGIKGTHFSPKTEFKKGFTPWNKGKKWTQRSGANNNLWKGGIYPEHLKIRHSVEMKRWRLKVFERDNYTCVLCSRFRKPGDRVILHADHYPKTFALLLKENNIKTFEEAKKFEKLWDISLGRTLCRECHLKTETHGKNIY